jgi:hypothetical protein
MKQRTLDPSIADAPSQAQDESQLAPNSGATGTQPRRARAAKPAPAAKRAAKAPSAKKTSGKKATPAKKAAKPAHKPASARESKQDQVVEMLRATGGATLAAIMKATGWQAHSVRGFIAGAVSKKLGLNVSSFKNDAGERTYAVKG